MGIAYSKFNPRLKYRKSVVTEDQTWSETLPDHIFDEIVLMIGLESLENLDTCRLVCKEWNRRIMKKLRVIRDHPHEKWRTILRNRIEKCWGPGNFPSDKMISHVITLEKRGIISGRAFENLVERIQKQDCFVGLPQIKCASSFARRGLLYSPGYGMIKVFLEGDLSSVPQEHLASLISCNSSPLRPGFALKLSVYLKNVTGCDLISLMDSLKCHLLCIQSLTMGREETQALVRAMETRVENVTRGSGYGDKVTLDLTELVKYSGEGRCKSFECYDTGARHGKKLKAWAMNNSWTLTKCGKDYRFDLYVI